MIFCPGKTIELKGGKYLVDSITVQGNGVCNVKLEPAWEPKRGDRCHSNAHGTLYVYTIVCDGVGGNWRTVSEDYILSTGSFTTAGIISKFTKIKEEE